MEQMTFTARLRRGMSIPNSFYVDLVKESLRKHKTIRKAAADLRMSRSTLHYWMRKYKIKDEIENESTPTL